LVPLVDPWGLLWAIWGLVVDPLGAFGGLALWGCGVGRVWGWVGFRVF